MFRVIKYCVCNCIILLCTTYSFAQNQVFIKGNFYSADGTQYNYDLQLKCITKDSLIGKVIYTKKEFSTLQQRFKNTFIQSILVVINRDEGTLYIKEGLHIGANGISTLSICFMEGTCNYTSYKGETYILGNLIAKTFTTDSCADAAIYLHTNTVLDSLCAFVTTTPFYKNPNPIDEDIVLNQLIPYVNNWKNLIEDTTSNATISIFNPQNIDTLSLFATTYLPISSNKIILSIMDYDTEDDDLIAIYLNDSLIINNHILTLEPLQISINLDPSKSNHELTFYAINVGINTPNTALISINDGEKVFPFSNSSGAKQKSKLVLQLK